jgi:octaprenyl-diphosphate synthase
MTIIDNSLALGSISKPTQQARKSFLYPISEDLKEVERVLFDEIRSEVRVAGEVSGHTLTAGGKRIRPAAMLLCARAVNRVFVPEIVYASAASVEMIHMATLIHDDVVDFTDSRRGRPTAHAVYGNQVSILTGDYLLAKSMMLTARGGNIQQIRIFSQVAIDLSEGELLQIVSSQDTETTEERYFDIIRKKTAAFIAGCCETGAILSEANSIELNAILDYGIRLGMAFQIADDILDYLGDPVVTGKPRCSDLREGKMTLPIIYALRTLDQNDPRRRDLSDLVENPHELDDDGAQQICSLIDKCGGFEYSRNKAEEFVKNGVDAIISVLPPTIYRDSLAELAQYAISRNS